MIKANWKSAKEDPSIFLVGMINLLQLASLLVCLGTLVSQLLYGPSHAQLVVAISTALLSVIIWVFTTSVGATQYRAQTQAKRSIDELLGMTEALQSAESYEDTATVMMSTSLELLPDLGGALYVFNNSRDRLDLVGSWNIPPSFNLADAISPSNCWSLKRGKPQINRPKSSKLRCAHHSGEAATLEVPMIAHGAIYGLLIFTAENQPKISTQFTNAIRQAQAMADAMSLALSNIALREKLRTQSIRDPLTGLFNRRYMEDALERYVSLAERSGTPTSVLMLDLDNFKRLNDEHGHAKGDAILRDVAAQLVGGLRPSDVVCRYGGEEILVILPDCSLDDAVLKAEGLRLRIEGLSEVHATLVSASIGVASIPQTSATVADLVAMADKALYTAKTNGKNCVASSEDRAAPRETKPALVVVNHHVK
jgi:diguanylate cyclase (GGDEF)-like protein